MTTDLQISTEQRREHFQEHGYIFIPNLLSNTNLLKKLQVQIFSVIEHRANLINYKFKVDRSSRRLYDRALLEMFSRNKKNLSFVYDVMVNSPQLSAVLNSDILINEISSLFGPRLNMVVSNNYNLRIDLPGKDWTENLDWHQDWPYDNPLYLYKNSIASWVAVFDVPFECGPLEIKDGSHNIGEIKPEKILMNDDYKRKNNFSYGVPKKYTDDKNYPTIPVPCKEGDVLLFDLTMIHRSGINTSDMIRWSAQARYHNVMNKDFLPAYKT